MQARTQTSALIIYFGALAMALTVTGLGLMAVVKTSAAWSEAAPREKTLLEIQAESAREIRRALAVPVTIPPLPPITAHLAQAVREHALARPMRPARPQLSEAALDAMAMGQSAEYQNAAPRQPHLDRHTGNW